MSHTEGRHKHYPVCWRRNIQLNHVKSRSKDLKNWPISKFESLDQMNFINGSTKLKAWELENIWKSSLDPCYKQIPENYHRGCNRQWSCTQCLFTQKSSGSWYRPQWTWRTCPWLFQSSAKMNWHSLQGKKYSSESEQSKQELELAFLLQHRIEEPFQRN
jgi:hypothetical protein